MKRSNPPKTRYCGLWICASLAILASTARADGGGTYSVYDTNRDGDIDRQEFVLFAKSRERKDRPNHFWQFERVDGNGDDKVSEREMVDALTRSLEARNN